MSYTANLRKCLALVFILSGMAAAYAAKPKCIMYLTGYSSKALFLCSLRIILTQIQTA